MRICFPPALTPEARAMLRRALHLDRVCGETMRHGKGAYLFEYEHAHALRVTAWARFRELAENGEGAVLDFPVQHGALVSQSIN